MRLAWVVVASSLIPATSEAAQRTRGSAGVASWAGGPDVFAGYSYTRAGEASLNGWQVSGAFPFGARLRLAAELARHSGSFAAADLKQAAFLAGPRRVWRSGNLGPFAQVLVGAIRSTTSVEGAQGSLSDSNTGWGVSPGGGLDYRLSRRWAVRGQAQLLFLRARGVWDTDPRLAVGASYRFGR